METTLGKQELASVGPIGSRGTVKLFPVGKKGTQRIAVGDDTGAVTAIEMKRGTSTISFRSEEGSEGVGSLVMGGPVDKLDRVFSSRGSRVSGVSKKGKEFFRLSTGLAHSISAMDVHETSLWVGAGRAVSRFDDGSEGMSLLVDGAVGSLVSGYVMRETERDCVVGSEDGNLSVSRGGEVAVKLNVDDGAGGGVRALKLMGLSGDASRAAMQSAKWDAERKEVTMVGMKHLVGGCGSGEVFHVACAGGSVAKGWKIANSGRARGGGVTAVDSKDVTGDGVEDCIVGRDDGGVQVFSLEGGADPTLVFRTSVGEAVRAIASGNVTRPEGTEVVVATHTGRLLALTSHSLEAPEETDRYGRARGEVARDDRMKQLQEEVKALEDSVKRIKGDPTSTTPAVSTTSAWLGAAFGTTSASSSSSKDPASTASQRSAGAVATGLAQEVKVTVTCSLVAESAAHRLVVESPVRVGSVLLRCPEQASVVEEGTAAGVLVSSERGGGGLVVTLRCQDAVSRLEFLLRLPEGKGAEVDVITTVMTTPISTAHACQIQIPPLGLHRRHPRMEDMESEPYSELVCRGSFTVAQVREWLVAMVSDVPSRSSVVEAASSEFPLQMDLESSLLHTPLRIRAADNHILIRAQSPTVLSVLREFLLASATDLAIRIDATVTHNPKATEAALDKLEPRLQGATRLQRAASLVDAARETFAGQPSDAFLSPDAKEALHKGDQLKEAAARDKSMPKLLQGVAVDLFIDAHKIANAADRTADVPQLLHLLQDYDPEKVRPFILPK